MKILYHHRTQGEEPESIHILAIVEALRALGHEVLLVGPAQVSRHVAGPSAPSLLVKIKRNVPRVVFELMQLAYNLIAYWRLARACRGFQPDLIYERYALFGFAGVVLARRRQIPLVLEVNTPYAQAWSQYYGLNLKRLARWLERRTLLAAGHVITVTEVQQRMLEAEGLRAECITVCQNAIDPAWFDPQRHQGDALRQQHALREVVVGFVGTMNRWQGIPEFPKVLEHVFAQADNVSFLFVGDGEFRAGLEDECRRRGWGDRVAFAGRQPHAAIPTHVAAMDITVLLNSNDYGSPMKIFEYYAMGKAVIAPRVAPVEEIMVDGVTGLIIERGNALEMARCIVELAADASRRARLGQTARDYVLANHTWRENAQKILLAHQRITQGEPTARPASSARA